MHCDVNDISTFTMLRDVFCIDKFITVQDGIPNAIQQSKWIRGVRYTKFSYHDIFNMI